MKKMKKIFAMLLAFTMVLGMTMTASAESGVPEATDTTTVTITGLTDNPTVTLYQIARGKYGAGNKYFVGYEYSTGVEFADSKAPTSTEIVEIANGILDTTDTGKPEEISAYGPVSGGAIDNEGTYTATVNAGMYIAIITGSSDGSVYNPILLSAYYDSTSTLVPGWSEKDEEGNIKDTEVDATKTYLYGSTAVAKKTTPSIDKVVSGTTADKKGDDSIHTASVGDVLTYTLTPTMPSYPVEAKNKTFYVTDTMTAGLTFDYATLTVTIDGTDLAKEGNNFKLGDDVVAKAASITNGFTLWFDYDKLIGKAGAVNQPIITYKAVVNKDAIVGGTGNTNLVEMYYSNKPNEGSTWEPETPGDRPDTADGTTKKTDSETVYTYQLAFLKTGEGTDSEKLANAVFGIYADQECTQMIDKVVTNANGYASSTNVKAGTYYIKEIEAPAGYSLNTKTYSIDANWATATTKDTATVTDCTYTTTKPSNDAVQVGWIKDGVFYEKNETIEGAVAAYISTTTTTTTSSSSMTSAEGGGTATSLTELTEDGGVGVSAIPNTKLIALPSTGGIGTTIFTVAGCGIMIAAAFFFFASRKKEN